MEASVYHRGGRFDGCAAVGPSVTVGRPQGERMRRWSEVGQRIAATTRTSEKTRLLADYLATEVAYAFADAEDKALFIESQEKQLLKALFDAVAKENCLGVKLKTYYAKKRKEYEHSFPDFYDNDLRQLFDAGPDEPGRVKATPAMVDGDIHHEPLQQAVGPLQEFDGVAT